MSELFGNPEQVSELSGNPEQLPYTPTTEEVRNADSGQPWTPTTQYVVERYADDWQGGTTPERVEQFDRWLNEVKAQTISDAIAYLKTTPAVTLTGKGGGYELLESYLMGEEQ